MSKSLFLSLVLCGLSLGLVSAPRAAEDPTPHQIYQATQAGQLGEAQRMVEQVLRDKPRSGQAHFVAAEVYAHAGNYARANQELSAARTLEPTLPFTTPAAVNSLESELSSRRISSGLPLSAPRSSHWSWGGLLLLIGAAWLVITLMRRRSQTGSYAGYPGNVPPAPGQPGYGMPGYGGMPPYGGGGSGLMGSLGTGLAVGAGVVAGEELMHHVLDGHGNVIPAAGAAELDGASQQNSDMGGQDFGISDGNSWGDDSGGSFGGDSGGGDSWS